MKNKERAAAVTFIGELPEKLDSIPIQPPTGFFWIMGRAWHGDSEMHGVAEVRIGHKGRKLDFALTLDDALLVRDCIDQAIDDMRRLAGDET